MTGKKVIIILAVVTLAFVIGAVSIAIPIYESGFWRGPDVKFGDQHLKTAVSLIELHRVRFGSYPRTLSELKYLGDWDKIHTNSVRYISNKDQDKYCVEVERGWVAKPELNMPHEFWKGTGYDSSLCR